MARNSGLLDEPYRLVTADFQRRGLLEQEKTAQVGDPSGFAFRPPVSAAPARVAPAPDKNVPPGDPPPPPPSPEPKQESYLNRAYKNTGETFRDSGADWVDKGMAFTGDTGKMVAGGTAKGVGWALQQPAVQTGIGATAAAGVTRGAIQGFTGVDVPLKATKPLLQEGLLAKTVKAPLRAVGATAKATGAAVSAPYSLSKELARGVGQGVTGYGPRAGDSKLLSQGQSLGRKLQPAADYLTKARSLPYTAPAAGPGGAAGPRITAAVSKLSPWLGGRLAAAGGAARGAAAAVGKFVAPAVVAKNVFDAGSGRQSFEGAVRDTVSNTTPLGAALRYGGDAALRLGAKARGWGGKDYKEFTGAFMEDRKSKDMSGAGQETLSTMLEGGGGGFGRALFRGGDAAVADHNWRAPKGKSKK